MSFKRTDGGHELNTYLGNLFELMKSKTTSKDSFLGSENRLHFGSPKTDPKFARPFQNQFDFVSNRQVDTNLAPVFGPSKQNLVSDSIFFLSEHTL